LKPLLLLQPQGFYLLLLPLLQLQLLQLQLLVLKRGPDTVEVAAVEIVVPASAAVATAAI
jgi:hypothetical protein